MALDTPPVAPLGSGILLQADNYLFNPPDQEAIVIDTLYNSQLLRNPTAPLLIYLPPTGSSLRHNHPSIPSHLNSNALARINYRWNHVPPPPHSSSPTSPSPSPLPLSSHPSYANHPFPTPIHDTLHAYTFLTTSYLPSFSPPLKNTPSSPTSKFSPKSAYYTSPPSKLIQRPLLLYGSYLGGTLATTLALTESFSTKQTPLRIAGLIAKNAIFDWSGIGTSLPPSTPSPTPEKGRQEAEAETHWHETTLHILKEKLFANPSSTFDAFVSPILFFRTAGLNVPKYWPGTEPEPSPEPESQYPSPPPSLSQDPASPSSSSPEHEPALGSGKRTTEHELETQRKSHLKFPTRDSGLKIPRALFIASSPSPFPSSPDIPKPKTKSHANVKGKGKRKKSKGDNEEVTPIVQAEEMAALMRRSVLLHEYKDRRVWDEDLDAESAAEERVWVRSVGGEEGEEEGEMVKEWIEDVLE
ncbi:hypothetical protein LHYA1_G000225 [Lachnellula hyalina]|uniref:Alpha/beta hydrolase fold-3 domain-containing protein n=1 Tax=Lachnellula hyalina TaxID=1316788 RepID=A0A8H8U5B5_9HELO|nr:uncharacterized protein LHYA1_G000225 [Lachnellula hyalina]TVY31049.1 hypothetical protein LHYA1_G000225 [Lachnellula hyalina]